MCDMDFSNMGEGDLKQQAKKEVLLDLKKYIQQMMLEPFAKPSEELVEDEMGVPKGEIQAVVIEGELGPEELSEDSEEDDSDDDDSEMSAKDSFLASLKKKKKELL